MRPLFAALAVVVALAVAGCGGASSTTTNGSGPASKSPTEVLSDTVNAARSAGSFHMSGNLSSHGQPVTFDFWIAQDEGAKGSLTINGTTVDLVVIGGNGYLKADKAFWNQAAGTDGGMIAARLAGKWLKFPVNNAQFKPFVDLSSPNTLFEGLMSSTDSTLKNTGVTTYKGQRVVALDDGKKNRTLYVAATATSTLYPVALVKAGGAYTFSDWNKPVTVTAPTNFVDFSQFSG